MYDFQSTEEFSKKLKVKPGTPRRSYCVRGHYMGIVPVKLPNGRLLWPTAPVDRLLNKEAK